MGPVTGARNERRPVAGRVPAPSPAEQARRWVEQSCAEQGLPSKVTDQAALRDVAVLMGGASEVLPDSGLPVRSYPVRVESVAASDCGADDDGVKESRDDGSLPSGSEGVPLAS